MIKIELKTLFSPQKIGNVEIKNRIIRSATQIAGASDDGYITDELINFYVELAKGGTGLIITEITSIDEVGRNIRNHQICLYNDSYIAGNKKLVETVHEYSDVKIAPQLSHAGRQGFNPVAPSTYLYKINKKTSRELKNLEIKEVISNFVRAGVRSYESGYDMVQLNAGHGWLLSNFLSPYINKRTDEYGGDVEGRTKILVDIFNQLRDEVGKNFPIFLKLQTQDFVEGGITLEEAEKIAKILVDTGYDAIEPSGGSGDTIFDQSTPSYPFVVVKSPEDENYFLPSVKRLKPIMKDKPLILMGGVRNPVTMEKFLQEGVADFIAMCRPFIYEPDLPNRWMGGDLSPALCTSCNQCLGTMMSGILYCPIRKKVEKRKEREEKKKA